MPLRFQLKSFQMSRELIIYTDGSCSGNPGPGGWAFQIYYGTVLIRTKSGHSSSTTNNRMEMTAVAEGLEAVSPGDKALIYTDSQYLVKGYNEWLPKWLSSGKTNIKNRDLWDRITAAVERLEHRVQWNWVRGHNGLSRNESVDKLAVDATNRIIVDS